MGACQSRGISENVTISIRETFIYQKDIGHLETKLKPVGIKDNLTGKGNE